MYLVPSFLIVCLFSRPAPYFPPGVQDFLLPKSRGVTRVFVLLDIKPQQATIR